MIVILIMAMKKSLNNNPLKEFSASKNKAIINTELLEIPKLIKASKKSNNKDPKIPRIIYQTFKSNCVPKGMYDSAMSWVKFNPTYEYRFFDDNDCITLIKNNFDQKILDIYLSIKIGAFRADIWRYCALYLTGGVYADIDTVCTRELDTLFDDDIDFIAPLSIRTIPYGIYNAFICTQARHPFLEQMIYRIKTKMQINKATNLFHITGPPGLGIAINQVLGRNKYYLFETGKYKTKHHVFKILGRKADVVDNGEIVLNTMYQGYKKDLKKMDVLHWFGASRIRDRKGYKRILRKLLGEKLSSNIGKMIGMQFTLIKNIIVKLIYLFTRSKVTKL